MINTIENDPNLINFDVMTPVSAQNDPQKNNYFTE